jgi:hypothetical protein
MQPLQLPLRTQTRVALVHSPEEAARVPEDLEPVLASGGRCTTVAATVKPANPVTTGADGLWGTLLRDADVDAIVAAVCGLTTARRSSPPRPTTPRTRISAPSSS